MEKLPLYTVCPVAFLIVTVALTGDGGDEVFGRARCRAVSGRTGNDQAAAILSAVRRAATPGATVLIIEAVADEEVLDPVVRTLDVIMLAITGGRERTSAPGTLDELRAQAGQKLSSLEDTFLALVAEQQAA